MRQTSCSRRALATRSQIFPSNPSPHPASHLPSPVREARRGGARSPLRPTAPAATRRADRDPPQRRRGLAARYQRRGRKDPQLTRPSPPRANPASSARARGGIGRLRKRCSVAGRRHVRLGGASSPRAPTGSTRPGLHAPTASPADRVSTKSRDPFAFQLPPTKNRGLAARAATERRGVDRETNVAGAAWRTAVTGAAGRRAKGISSRVLLGECKNKAANTLVRDPAPSACSAAKRVTQRALGARGGGARSAGFGARRELDVARAGTGYARDEEMHRGPAAPRG